MEGLAYLTSDADVKDDFVEDEPALRAMFELATVRLTSNNAFMDFMLLPLHSFVVEILTWKKIIFLF